MKTLLRSAGSSALILVCAAAAMAQQAGGPPPGGEAMAGAGLMRWTPENVDPANPFGDVDVNAAGNTPEQVETFLTGLTTAQLMEVIGRCSVVTPMRLTVDGAGEQGIGAQANMGAAADA